MKNKALAIFASLVILLLPLFGCTAPTVANDRFTIVCSIFVPYDFARHVAGDRAEIKMLLPPGVESHSYEPTPSDIITIENADVFLYVSEHTETWVAQLVKSLNRKQVEVVDMAEALGIKIHDHEHHNHEEHEEHDECETDEHIWTNLETAADMVRLTADILSKADPVNSSFYASNAHSYINEIIKLKNEFDDMISTSKRKEIVSGSRFAMKNFTGEFGLDFTAAFDSCVDNTEPSAGVMAKIIDKINEDNIPVVFYEELTEPKIARAVSLETGAKMLLLHSCHNVSASEVKSDASYLSLMTQNYINLKEALG